MKTHITLIRLLVALSVSVWMAPLSMAPLSMASEHEQIAIVDVQRVINESIIGKAARSNLEQQINKAKLRVASLKNDFDKQAADLEKQSSILSSSAMEQRREALGKKQVDMQRSYQDIQEELARANDKEIGKVLEQITEIVKDLSKDRGYLFVFEKDKQSVVFASSRIDITPQIIEALDKKKLDL